MELTLLLQEESNIKEKITVALKEIKEWFEKKIDEIKEIATSIKDKISAKLKSFKSKIKLKGDVIDKNNKKILDKDDNHSKILSKINSLLSNLKKECTNGISECKKGIQLVINHNSEGAISSKTKVKVAITAIGASVTGLLLIMVKLAPDIEGYANQRTKATSDLEKNEKKIDEYSNNYYKRAKDLENDDRTVSPENKKEYDYLRKMGSDIYVKGSKDILAKHKKDSSLKEYIKNRNN